MPAPIRSESDPAIRCSGWTAGACAVSAPTRDLATLQNWDVQQCDERDIAVDLREHACLIAVGSDGVCVPELETRQLADACRE